MKTFRISLLVLALTVFVGGMSLAVAEETSTSTKDRETNKTIKREAALEKRITNWQNRGAKEIDARISSLNKIGVRVAEMKKISESDKSSIKAAISTVITDLSNLKSNIISATSTASLEAYVKSIKEAYRIYALVEPRINIITAADRIKQIADDLNAIGSKVKTRLAQNPSGSTNTEIAAALADFDAKIADAATKAQSAVSDVSVLKPDNGDKTIMQANTATLQNARKTIKSAHQDLIAARKDLHVIVSILIKDLKSLTNTNKDGTTSSTASSTRDR